LHAAAEAHAVVHLGPLELPGVAAREPVVGRFDLLAVDDALAEHAVLVADAVAHARHAERGHRIEETGREPAQAAVAQRRIGLALGQRSMSTPKSASASRTVSCRSSASSALVKVRPMRNSIER
jgi:hypothetical protein